MFTLMFTLKMLLLLLLLSFYCLFSVIIGLESVFLFILTELLLPRLNGRPIMLLWLIKDWLFDNKLYDTPNCGVWHLFYLLLDELILSILPILFIPIADERLFRCWEWSMFIAIVFSDELSLLSMGLGLNLDCFCCCIPLLNWFLIPYDCCCWCFWWCCI